jgi:hypothetical protein
MYNLVASKGSAFVATAYTLLTLFTTESSAQQFGALPTVIDRSDLRAVEAEARAHPELPASHLDPLWWRENEIPGTADRRCTAVPRQGPVRSGDFAIWYGSLSDVQSGRENKVAWAPTENSREMALTVRAQLIGDPSASVSLEHGLGRPYRPGEPPREDEWFFPSGISFSKPGEWVVVATSGRNWGCFVFQVVQATADAG